MVTSNAINGDWNISKMLNLLKKRGYKLEFRREASIPLERKGLLIDACNVYRDNISPAMMQKLNSVYQTTITLI